ncbi:DUF6531 domain-containing protein [Streptomyces formicae]
MAGDNMASMMEFLGISDPAVDPDGVREIAKKWRALAKAVDDSVKDAERSLKDVTWEGKTATAFNKRAKKTRSQASQMADSLRDGADALDKYADESHELLTELNVIILEIIEVEMASLALSVLTGGVSAVVGNLAAGARFAKAMALVGRIEHAGTAMARTIRAVLEVIRGLSRALRALKEIKSIAKIGKLAGQGAKYAALDTLLKDPATFKDPGKLAETLAVGAALGVGVGGLAKLLGKGLGKLKPKDLSKLRGALKLNCSSLKRLKMRPGWDKLPASVQKALKKFVRDPIDVATGDMALTCTDIELPGVLPLLLERTHISSYRHGGWFGPSWASTIDQRIQVDDEGLVFAAEDGSRLCFPLPDPETNKPVRPDTPGSRLTVSWDSDIDGALRVTDPDTGYIRVFHSPVPAAEGEAVDLPLQFLQDRNGNRITVQYDERLGDLPRAVVHSGGYHIEFDHHESTGRITRLRLLDPAARDQPGTTLITFSYDAEGRLTEEFNSSGLPMRYAYDAEGRITSWTDRNDTTYWYTYDEQGRVTATGGTGDALASVLTYDDATRTTRVSDSLGHIRVYEHNEALRLVRETDPLGHATVQEWDEDLQLVAVTDPLGYQRRYVYDDRGRVIRVIRQDGSEVTSEYNELNLPTLVVSPDGSRWTQEYDENGNPVTVTDAAGRSTHLAYDQVGGLRSVTDALGYTTSVRNGATGIPVEVTDALGATRTTDRDAFGRPVVLTDPLGARTLMEWTVEGKLVRRVAADGSEEAWLYDGEGNCTHHTDANGGVSRFEYTHFDLMAARTGPDGVRYEFTHDSELRLVQVLNPQGLSWNYEYDAVGRLIAESDFDGRVQRYTHDAAGQLTRRTTPLGELIRYSRDLFGRVTRKDAAGAITDFSYDSAGRMLHAAGPDALLEWLWDEQGQLSTERTTTRRPGADGPGTREVSHAYDGLGRRTSRVTPTGVVSTWSYDAGGNRAELTTAGHCLSFVHDAARRETSRRIGNDLTFTHTFDELGRLTTQSVEGAQERRIHERTYRYRADGYPTGVEDLSDGVRAYDLDAVGRVTGVAAPGWRETYAYDAAGNQTDAAWPTAHPASESQGQREYAGTRILRAGSVRYEHDAAGRIVLRQKIRLSRKPDTWRYEWDAEDRMTSVVTPDGTRWRYTYDALGRRTAKFRMAEDDTAVVERTDFAWDGTTLCEQTTTNAESPNPVTLTWDHQGSQPVAQTERIAAPDVPQEEIDSRFFAIVTDLVGSPTELLDEKGDVAWRSRSTLWGTTTWSTTSTAYTPLRFPGQYYDPESGLHYNYFRHYDPETARYLTTDPLGLTPAPNPVTYVHNPLSWTDPLGLSPSCDENITVYRKQDTSIPETMRLHVDADGNVSLTGNGSLYVNMTGDVSHSLKFKGDQLVSFDVPSKVVDDIAKDSLPQRKPRGWPGTNREWAQLRKVAPDRSDGPGLFGLPDNGARGVGRDYHKLLMDAIIPGSGRTAS